MVELVDTRDLKSLARLSMRVRVPPVLPTRDETYPIEGLRQVDNLDVMVYNSKGKLVSIEDLWSTKMRWKRK